MADAGIDALILGREGNARFVSGAETPLAQRDPAVRSRLRRGARHRTRCTCSAPPTPASRRTIGHDQLYPLSWNPMTIAGTVAAIPGMADATTVGVDGMTPMMEQLLGAVLAQRDLRRRRDASSARCAGRSPPRISTGFAARSAWRNSASRPRPPR